MSQQKTFCSVERSACGQSEMWTHFDDHNNKFKQFGWRCTNSESGYRHGVKIGNWSEENSDYKQLRISKTIPSQYSCNYNSTYENDFNDELSRRPPQELTNLKRMPPHAFPSHQPVLDTPTLKRGYASWETTARQSYAHPKLRTAPLGSPPPPLETLVVYGCQATGEDNNQPLDACDIERKQYTGKQVTDRPS